MNGEFSGGGQGVATYYWTAHGVSPVITSVFGRLCRITITRGKEDTRSGNEKRCSQHLPCAWILFGFCPPPHPLQQFNGPSVSMQHVSHKHSFGFFPKNNRIHPSCMIYRSQYLNVRPVEISVFLTSHKCIIKNVSKFRGYLHKSCFRNCFLSIQYYIYRCTLPRFRLQNRFLHWDMDWNHKLGKEWHSWMNMKQ